MSNREKQPGTEVLTSLHETKSIDCLEQLYYKYSVFLGMLLKRWQLQGKRLALEDEEYMFVKQTKEPFQRLEELDSQLVGYIMENLSERQHDCVSCFYNIGRHRDTREQMPLPFQDYPEVNDFSYHGKKAFKDGLLKMQSNVGLMMLWLETGTTYEDMKNQWPLLPDQPPA